MQQLTAGHTRVRPGIGALLVAEAAAASGGLAAAALGGPHWGAGAAALALGGGVLARHRGTSAAQWAVDRLRRPAAPHPAAVPAPYPGGGDIAVRAENGLLTAALQPVAGSPRVVSMLDRDDAPIPLDVLARALRHADTPAARIDIAFAGGRAPSNPPNPRTRYEMLLGPIGRWAVADVRIAVSVAPADCAAAVARRGGDRLRVAALAARRVADALAAEGLATVPVGVPDLDGLRLSVPDGAAHAHPERLAAGDLEHLLLQSGPCGRAQVTLRRDRDDEVTVAAWLDLSGAGPGPVGEAARGPAGAAFGPAAALRGLHVPHAGCGQILGAGAAGGPVAARLHGPGVHAVWAAVADDPARQLVERAVATGARVLLVTGRPAMWEPLVSWVSAPEALWISGWRYPPGPRFAGLGPRDYTVTVLDGTAAGQPAGSVEPHGTVWRIEAPGISPVMEADVVLSQPQPGMLTVRTDGAAATLRLVA